MGAEVPALPPGEPELSVAGAWELMGGYLDYYRGAVLRKLEGLSEAELRGSRVPSGWSPLTLVRHLTYMERRWLVWGFEGEQVSDPWGDQDASGEWYVPEGVGVEEVLAAFREQAERSRRIVAAVPAPSLARARVGGRFGSEGEAPALSWILFHVLQEYARHVGQLDVSRELADGATGE